MCSDYGVNCTGNARACRNFFRIAYRLFLAALLLPAMAGAATVSVPITADADDGEANYAVLDWWSAGNQVAFDRDDRAGSFRFINLNLPDGVVIADARIQFEVAGSRSDTFGLNIYGFAETNSARIANFGDWNSRPRTPPVTWQISNPVGGIAYNTSDISSIIQEIYGLGERNAFHITINSTASLDFKVTDSRATLNDPRLFITYVPEGTDITPPSRSNGQPTGTLPSGTTSTTMSLDATDSSLPVACRYSATAGTPFSSMTGLMTNTAGNTFSATVSGLANGNTYAYYARCEDSALNQNTADFAISFSVAAAPTPTPTPSGTPVPTPTPTPTVPPGTGAETSVGTLSAVATFRSIGIITSYSGDNDDDNSASLEYKERASSTWKNAHPLSIPENNRGKKQWAGSIVVLQPDTEYDLRITFSDPDGIFGTNPLTTTLRTRAESFPSGGGTTYYVSPAGNDANNGLTQATAFKTIQKAAGIVNPGDTVLVMPGTYYEEVTISRSGTASNYITFRSFDANNKAIIDGSNEALATIDATDNWLPYSGTVYYTTLTWDPNYVIQDSTAILQYDGYTTFADWQTNGIAGSWYFDSGTSRLYVKLTDGSDPDTHRMRVAQRTGIFFSDADYIRIKDFEIRYYNANGIYLRSAGDGANYDVIEGNTIYDGTSTGGGPAIRVGGSSLTTLSSGNVIQNNYIYFTGSWWAEAGGMGTIWNIAKDSRDGEATGIGVGDAGNGNVIRNNTIQGGFDAFGSGRGAKNTDIYDNYAFDCGDDGFFVGGTGAGNVRVWNNRVKNCLVGISVQMLVVSDDTTYPVYVFRNSILNIRGDGFKIGLSSPPARGGPSFIYHNTLYSNGGNGASDSGGAVAENYVFRNNVIKADTYAFQTSYVANVNNDINYDNLEETPDPGRYIKWGNVLYTTLAGFTAATGREANGLSVDSQLVDPANEDFRLRSTSPLIDKGVILQGFNDAGSAWPYRGTGPDIGAFEYDSGAPPPFSFTISASPASGTVSQGGTIAPTVTASLTSGTTQPVTFSASGLPSGASASFSPTSCSPTCSSTMTLTAGSTTPTGSYSITITGTGGITATYNLTVIPAGAAPPSRINGAPSGTLPASTASATLSLGTDKAATCRYATTAGVAYDSMTNTFATTGSTSHSQLVIGLMDGGAYNYYVRCSDASGNKNTDDFLIAFSVDSGDTSPPVLSNGQPSGTLANGTTSTTISVATDEVASCRYATTAGVAYDSMTNTFATTGSTSHSQLVIGLMDGGAYNYYVRCSDSRSNKNAADFTLSFGVSSPSAPGVTTAGALSLVPTIGNIGVVVNYSGDSNGNNRAVLEYKELSSATWKTAPEMYADRIDRQHRGSIFWLSPNTQYNVKVTFYDADGVSGSPVAGTVRTNNDNPAIGTSYYYVSTSGSDSNSGRNLSSPFRTIQKAASVVAPGDTVLIRGGTYNEMVTISASGTASGYITFMPYNSETVIVDGEGTRLWAFVVNNADYIRIRGLALRNTRGVSEDGGAINFNRADYCIAEYNTITNAAPGSFGGSGIGSANIKLNYAGNCLVQNNTFNLNNLDTAFGVVLRYAGDGNVVRYNTMSGQLHDGIASWPEDWPDGYGDNTDVYGNNISGNIGDDGMQLDGDNVNVRIWDNRVGGSALVGISVTPVLNGPAYVFRNVIVNPRGNAFKLGDSRDDLFGRLYLYHNTIYTNTGANGFGQTDYTLGNVVSRNNVISAGYYAISMYGLNSAFPNDLDYDVVYSTFVGGSRLVKWDGSVTYTALSAFVSATGQEQRGIAGAPMFVNPSAGNLALQPASPAVDAGILLPGFNDENSPWPFKGNAPDMGAFEFQQSINRVISPSFITPVIVDGQSITVRMLVDYNESGAIATVRVSKPVYLSTSNFRLNESGTIKTVSDMGSEIEWSADTSKTSYLLFDIPTPRKTRNAVAIDNGTFYRKEINVSAENSFANVQANATINSSYTFWKLYELRSGVWTDVTSGYNLQVNGPVATFSGFSMSEKQFRLEGSISPPAPTPTPTPTPASTTSPPAQPPSSSGGSSGGGSSGGGSSGGGSGPGIAVLSKEEKPLDPKKDVIETVLVETPPVKGNIGIAIEGDDVAENGEPYTAFVVLSAARNVPNVSVFVSGVVEMPAKSEVEWLEFIDNSTALFYSKRIVADLARDEEERIRFDFDVPSSLKGGFSLRVAVSDGTESEMSKPVRIDFRPVVLAVNESGVERKFISISVKSFENDATTELTVTRDGTRVASGTIEGKKEYSAEVEASKPGTYEVKAVMKSLQGDVLDEDMRRFVIEAREQPDTNVILAVAVLVIIALGYFYYHGRRHVRKANELISGAVAQILNFLIGL